MFWTQQTASAIDGAGLLFAMLLIGFGYLLLGLVTIGVIDVFIRRQASYSLAWWSIVFPLVVFTTALLELAHAMDSPTFRGLVTALTVILSVIYFINLAFTIKGVVIGSLVFGPRQLDIEEGMIKKAQDNMENEEV